MLRQVLKSDVSFIKLHNWQETTGRDFVFLTSFFALLLFNIPNAAQARENLLRGSVDIGQEIQTDRLAQSRLSQSGSQLNPDETNIPESRLQQKILSVPDDLHGNILPQYTMPTTAREREFGAAESVEMPAAEDISAQGIRVDEADLEQTSQASPNDTNMRVQKIGRIDTKIYAGNERQKRLQGRGLSREEDAYAAAGIRLGNFILRPTFEQGIKATSNGSETNTGSDAVISQTGLRFLLTSDWLRHGANFDLQGKWSRSISGEDVSAPELSLNGDYRYDLTDRDTLNFAMNYLLRRESGSSPDSVNDVKRQPFYRVFRSSIGIKRENSLIFGEAVGQFELQNYDNAHLNDGSILNQKDRDKHITSIRLRGGYELSGSIKPFVETEYGKRIFRDKYDRNGFQRSGDEWALRAGVIIDRGEKFNGELAVGYVHVGLDDPRLSNMSGLSIKGHLNWSPVRGTQLRWGVGTASTISTTAYQNGTFSYFSDLELTHQLRSNLFLNAKLDLLLSDYQTVSEKDWTLGAEIGATYWVNRYFALDTALRYERLFSDVSERQYSAKSIYGGIKMQR